MPSAASASAERAKVERPAVEKAAAGWASGAKATADWQIRSAASDVAAIAERRVASNIIASLDLVRIESMIKSDADGGLADGNDASKLTASEARIYLRCRYGSNSVLVGARTLATRLHFNLETLASTLLPF